MIKVTVTDRDGTITDEISFDEANIFHKDGTVAIVSRDAMRSWVSDGLWHRVAHAAAWVAESHAVLDTLLTTEPIATLHERLLTGWAPRAGEINSDVRQIDALNWEWSDDGHAITAQTIDRRPQRYGDILYVSRSLDFALTAEAMLWLYDAKEAEKIRFLGG